MSHRQCLIHRQQEAEEEEAEEEEAEEQEVELPEHNGVGEEPALQIP